MLIKHSGKYILLENVRYRTINSVSILPAGKRIHVTQVDTEHYHVYVPELKGWYYWDLPAKKVIG